MSDPATSIRIVPAALEYAALEYLDSFRECIDSIARERKRLGMVQAHPPEQVQEFWSKQIADDAPAFFALDGDRVVGFAHIEPYQRDGIRHRGHLGMGAHIDYRGRGVGTQLMEAVIAKAKRQGLMRIDLGVYASNTAAIALYRKLGFVEEGRTIKGRYLDGRFEDIIQMGLIFEENLPKNNDQSRRAGKHQ